MAEDDANEVDGLLAGYPVTIEVPVQWGDQDAFAHVNNVTYFRWFESARIAYFLRVNLMNPLEGSQIGPILAASSCDYRRAIVFPDTVRVGIRASRIGRTSIAFEHRIVSLNQRALAAEGTSTTVVYDYVAKCPRPVPDDLRRAIEELEGSAR
jgi:acyl-CoA thioester hydrolase